MLLGLAAGPRPARACEEVLFTIERSLNANVVVYEALLEPTGAFLARKPVDVNWILKATTGEREGLNFIEKGVYGYHVEPPAPDGSVVIRLKARRNLPITLRKEGDCAGAWAPISGREARLAKVWVQVKGRGIFSRTVEYLDVIGFDPATAGEVRERIVP
ncbi:MAG TPA: DUF4833 domain-containing protein [Thermoanaerobaculia bacterium]|nr:DUF4833 domain-containing protein [Thermoanaerobaculia bacterium]HQR66643.1 DUF4833 domain-containing protein [Thermoanaerobaculia bacterium]